MIPRPILRSQLAPTCSERPQKKVRFEGDCCPENAEVLKRTPRDGRISSTDAIEPRLLFKDSTIQTDAPSRKESLKIPLQDSQKENRIQDKQTKNSVGSAEKPVVRENAAKWGKPGSKRAAFFAAISNVFKNVLNKNQDSEPSNSAKETTTIESKAQPEQVTAEQPVVNIAEKPGIPAAQLDEDEEGVSSAEQGNAHFRRGDFAAALRCYDAAIQAREDSHLVRSNRSACLHQLGRHHEALRDARIAILQAPGWPPGRCRKAAAQSTGARSSSAI